MTRKPHPGDRDAPVDTTEARADKSRDELRRELKSGQYDPNTAHQPQEVRKHPTEGERMQFGDAAPGVVPDDDAILPDRGKPVPESLPREAARAKAKEQFRKFPSAAYMTKIESWRVLDGDAIEFTMRRLKSAD